MTSRQDKELYWIRLIRLEFHTEDLGRRVLPYKGLGTCGQPGYVFRDFCLKQGIKFIIFCLNQGIDLSIFVLTGCLFLDDKQQNFYKRLLINIRVKCLKQGIKKIGILS